MRHYPFASYSVIFLIGFFVLGATEILANPLIYGENPWDEDDGISIMEGIAGTGSNTTGERSSSDVTLESFESGESDASESTMLMGGDYSKMSSAAAHSTSLLRQNFNYFFTSPMAVAHSAVAMTGGIIHQGLVKAQEASQREVHGALEQEQAYLTSIAESPRLIAAYRNCKKRMLAGNPTPGTPEAPVTNFQAIKHCVGGYDETPFVLAGVSGGALSEAGAETQVQLEDQENRPEPIYVEKAVRNANGDSDALDTARGQCAEPQATYSNQLYRECYERSLWDYVYHFVKKRPLNGLIARNPLKWMWSDEKALYFGNKKYTEYKMSDYDSGQNSTEEQQNEIVTKRKKIPPAKRWVNFWGPNGESVNLPGILPLGYDIGTWSPLSGIELIRAAMFQDIYGGLYALSIKMCEHANAELELLKDTDYNGFNPKCELWNAPLDAQWGTGNVTVPGLGVTVQGCELSMGPPSDIWERRIFPETTNTNNVDYEFLWPSRLRLEKPAVGGSQEFADSDRVNWQPRRYYENWENISELPTIKSLLQHLELTEHEALMLRDILLHEIPKDTETGEYQCNEILNGVSYGEIMEFSEEKIATHQNDSEWMLPFSLLMSHTYRSPKSSAWPIRSQVKVPEFYGSSPLLNPEIEKDISKRISLFYNYANLIGKARALAVVEKHLGSLNAQVNSIKEFPEQMEEAALLIRSQLPGESIGASMTQRTHLRDELITVKEMLRDLHLELKSAARFTDKAGKRRNVGAGAAGTP